MENWKREFLKKLEQELEPYRVDSIFLEEDGTNPDTLRQMFDVGENQAAPIVMDQAVFNLENGKYMLNIYTEMALEVEKSQELLECINRINFTSALGTFGYYEEQKQLYHKYNLLIDEPENVESLVKQDMDILDIILAMMINHYEELNAIADKKN